jgi:hypothetical protein
MQNTIIIDPNTWGEDIQMKNSTCLHDFNIFVGNIQKMNSDKNWRLNEGIKSYYDCPQGYYNASANVGAYVIRLRWNR